jgi:hypothetical protein
MPPMSIFDQHATRMWASFAGRPRMRAYRAIQPQVVPFGQPGLPTNTADGPLGAESAGQDFSAPDRADEHTLNTATCKSVRGARSRMPAPRHRLVMPPGSAGEDEGDGD